MNEIKLWLAAENERLEAELAAANAKIKALRPSEDRFLSSYEEGRCDAINEVLDILDGSPKLTDNSDNVIDCGRVVI